MLVCLSGTARVSTDQRLNNELTSLLKILLIAYARRHIEEANGKKK